MGGVGGSECRPVTGRLVHIAESFRAAESGLMNVFESRSVQRWRELRSREAGLSTPSELSNVEYDVDPMLLEQTGQFGHVSTLVPNGQHFQTGLHSAPALRWMVALLDEQEGASHCGREIASDPATLASRLDS